MTSNGLRRPVREQLSGCKPRDIDVLMRRRVGDRRYYDFPGALPAGGAGEARARHADRLKDETLAATLLGRTVLGNDVVDLEHVRRRLDGAPGEGRVLGICEIEEGLIRRAWFVQTRIPVNPTA